MKKISFVYLLLFATICHAQSQKFMCDSLVYSIISEGDKTVELYSHENIGDGNIIIPETVDYEGEEYTIVSIFYNCFRSCTDLISIVLPNSITSIIDGSFEDCTNLKSVDFGDSIISIGHRAFDGCINLDSIIFKETLTSIGNSAFHNCKSLKSVILPNSLTSILYYTFSNCTGLTEIELGNSVAIVYPNAFDSCSALNSFSITTIVPPEIMYGSNPFTGLTLSEIELNVPDEGLNKYQNSEVWKDFYYNEYGTKGYSFNVDGLIYTVNNTENHTVTVTGFTTLGDGNVIIPDTVTYMNNSYIVNTLANNVFNYFSRYHYNDLKSIELSNYITSIEDSSFLSSPLTSIKMRSGVTSIGRNAFSYCTNLISITFSDNLKDIGSMAFFTCFAIESIDVPNSVCTIGDSAFFVCENLKNATLGNSIKSIGTKSFYRCESLEDIDFPESLENIGNNAFLFCPKMKNLILPNSLTYISESSFAYCLGLKSITVGNAVDSIGASSFEGCDSINSFTITTATPPVVGEHAFDKKDGSEYINMAPKIALYVPNENITDYQETDIWKDFNIIITENNILQSNTVSIFPNPVSDYLTIKLTDNAVLKKAVIYNCNGKAVTCSTEREINVNNLPIGAYSIIIETNKNCFVKSFLKKN